VGDNVTSIGHLAFAGCKDLKSVKLSNNLIEIGAYAFANCTSLRELDFSECTNLRVIHEGAFFGSEIGRIILPDLVDYLGNYSISSSTYYLEISHHLALNILRRYISRLDRDDPALRKVSRLKSKAFECSLDNELFVNALSEIGILYPKIVTVRGDRFLIDEGTAWKYIN
jgi:hypothetical protein